jgi:hypothetical protein
MQSIVRTCDVRGRLPLPESTSFQTGKVLLGCQVGVIEFGEIELLVTLI